MNALTRYAVASVIAAVVMVASSVVSASAQTIGTFPFALQPFCNTIQLTVTLEGSTYRLAGWDDGCGATTVRQPVFGTIAPNQDGTLHLGFTAMGANGVAVETSIRNLAIGPYTGAWTDSAGNSGTAVIVGVSGAVGTGGPRPGPSSMLLPNSVTTGTIVDGAVTTAKILDGSVGAADVNSAEVQRRVSQACTAGSFIRSINADGSVVCGSGPVVRASEAFPLVGLLDTTCRNTATLSFGTVAAGIVSCTGALHVNLNHTSSTLDRVISSFSTTSLDCDPVTNNQSEYEIPAANPSEGGIAVAIPVVKIFSVPAGALTVYLNSQMTLGADASDFLRGHNAVCTFTPQ